MRQIATTGVAGLATAALLTLAAGPANAATTEECAGTGPAASMSTTQHDAFLREMTALKDERDAIRKKYAKISPRSGKGQSASQRARGAGRGTKAKLTTKQRTAKRAELAAWRVSRDALFDKYGISASSQARSA